MHAANGVSFISLVTTFSIHEEYYNAYRSLQSSARLFLCGSLAGSYLPRLPKLLASKLGKTSVVIYECTFYSSVVKNVNKRTH